MALKSFVCALSGEPIPTSLLDPQHGSVSVFLSDTTGLRGSYSGFGILMDAIGLKRDQEGVWRETPELPLQCLNTNGEVDVFRAWVSVGTGADYDSMEMKGEQPEHAALREAVVVKNIHMGPDSQLTPSTITPGGVDPHDGLFYDSPLDYQRPIDGWTAPESAFLPTEESAPTTHDSPSMG
ncbi:hypothetical protein EZI54_07130 [Marinobacter halodurans]|uniref:Uncharacterized protein n=1 Tax=Marinobacter halodurans TaxID=2528979 RepID=A0ABY1ZM98_9GAMM|nr:hypothetical protein [Marinobacter halodurans]TBW57424.1 hypothetical protein EZI54_07130 [Marinobacter halodurans]